MERRLQERCADLQREIFRLQGAHHQDGYKTLEKRPVALPRHVPPHTKLGSSEQDDEGISSSETGQSLSPEPILILPQSNSQKYRLNITSSESVVNKDEDDANNATIEDVIEELENIVNDAEREISIQNIAISERSETVDLKYGNVEKEIVPVNLLPQPPRKSRSLAHLLSNGSDFDGSEYGMLLIQNGSRTSFFDDLEFENANNKFGQSNRASYSGDEPSPDVVNQSSTNREILNVIMDAREKDQGIQGFMAQKGVLPVNNEQHNVLLVGNGGDDANGITITTTSTPPPPPSHKFSGVFFMTEMNTPQKYPKPDITAALEARRVTKNLDRIESYGNGLDSMIDIVLTDKQAARQQILLTGSNTSAVRYHQFNGLSGSQLNRHAHSNNGSRVTDLPSGLY